MVTKKLNLAQFNKADLLKGKHILIVEYPGSRRAVSLSYSVFSIGRHPNNSLVLADKMVSRHHATIAWMRYSEQSKQQDYAYWVIDGKGKTKRSLNGVFINGNKKPLHRLMSGDIITLGKNIKITYNYIPCNSETHDFLKYYDSQKNHYYANATQTNYKDTIVIDN